MVSDQLRDWALEVDGRVPSRRDFVEFIRAHTETIPDAQHVVFVLSWLMNRVLEEHTSTIRENSTYRGRDDTRAWYGRGKAPDAIYLLYILRKLLLRLPSGRGPMLERPLDALLATLWRGAAPSHPLLKECFGHYESTELGATEADVRAWKQGETRPHFRSLAVYFRGHGSLPEILLNFAVALLIENLGGALAVCIPQDKFSTAADLLIRQARCLSELEHRLSAESQWSACLSLADYADYLVEQVTEFRAVVVDIVNQGDATLLDLRWSALRCHRDYFEGFSRAIPPPGFDSFYQRLAGLWNETGLDESPASMGQAGERLAALRRDFPAWSESLAGVLLAVDARLALVRETAPTSDTLLSAFALYREAVVRARYCVGPFTRPIIGEALGLAALIQRGKVAEGSRLLDWIKNTLAWWDLVGLGSDFDHEQEPQRVEKAERLFVDGLHDELRQKLREGFALPALDHVYLGGIIGFVEPEAEERLGESLDKRQKRELRSAATGRDQSPLMEAIDRHQLSRAFELVQAGADLNFINSTGDTCVTKAFACDAYDLVLAILSREQNPILHRVLARETDKHRHSALERAISHGRVDVLRELAKWKRDRGGEFDLSEARVQGSQTALFYAVDLLAYHRSPPGDFPGAPKLTEGTKVLKAEFAKHGYPPGLGHPDLAGEVIAYLIDEAEVEVDVTCTNGHTAFTLAVEKGMHDVALRLLQAGANVNHRCDDGATALCFAIRDDDYEMAKLLHEHRANDRLVVEIMGRPINAMEMSDRIRQLYPRRF